MTLKMQCSLRGNYFNLWVVCHLAGSNFKILQHQKPAKVKAMLKNHLCCFMNCGPTYFKCNNEWNWVYVESTFTFMYLHLKLMWCLAYHFNRMKPVPVFFLSLYISPSACFSVTHDVLTHSRWAALAFFSPVYGHTAIALNCPVTFQKFSCHMEPSQGLKDAEYVRFSINFHFKTPEMLHIIIQTQLSQSFVLLIASLNFSFLWLTV